MKKSRGLLVAAAALMLLLAAGALTACGSSGGSSAAASPSNDVVAAAKADDQLSQFSQALNQAGLDGKGPYTVFAPSNDAVSKAGVTISTDIVKASVIEGTQLAEPDMTKGTKNDAMLADNTIVTYTGSDGALYVNTFKVIGDPVAAANGVVYVIDGVIQPK